MRIQKYCTFMTSKTPGSSGVMNRISRHERTAPVNTLDNGGDPAVYVTGRVRTRAYLFILTFHKSKFGYNNR
jgi:hypothetical protein